MVAESREYFMRIRKVNEQYQFTATKKASSHRNAVMLAVNEFGLNNDYEVEVQEVVRLPKSTYRVYEHTTREIEMKC